MFESHTPPWRDETRAAGALAGYASREAYELDDVGSASRESHEFDDSGSVATQQTSSAHGSATGLVSPSPATASPVDAPGIVFVPKLKTWKLATAIWLGCAGLTAMCWVFHSQVRENPLENGLVTLMEGPCDGIKGVHLKSWSQNSLLGVTVASAFITFAVNHFRTGLLAPSPKFYLSETSQGGDVYLGVDSLRGFLAISWYRKLLYIALLLASFPMYSILLFVKYPAYNSYEILISSSFFDGAAFNLSGVNATRYRLNETPTMPPINATWPADYGAFDNVTQSLTRLQQDSSIWRHLSRESCVAEFNKAENKQYRTLVLVTNFTDTKSPKNNSVLAASILPGYRLVSASSSLVALCPDVYLQQYPRARRPSDPPFMSIDESYGTPNDVKFVSPSEAEAWATNASSPTSHRRRQATPPMAASSGAKYDPMPSRELCYNYWAYLDKWEYKYLYRVPQCPLEYCIAEPFSTPLTCQAMYNPRVLWILSITLSITLSLITAALLLRMTRDGIYSAEDAAILYSSRGTPRDLRRGWGDDDISYHTSMVYYPQEFLNLAVFIYLWVLWGVASKARADSLVYPTNPSNHLWLLQSFAAFYALHAVFDLLFFFQTMHYTKRAFRTTDHLALFEPITDPAKDPSIAKKTKTFITKTVLRRQPSDPHSPGFLVKTGTFLATSPKSRQFIWLPVRSGLVHLIYSLVFITQLRAVMPLDTPVGSFAGEKLVAFTTLGLPAFNERTDSRWWLFLLFNASVFVFLPMLWLEGAFFAARGGEHWGFSLSTMVAGPGLVLLGIVSGIVVARGN
ncbi:hypothetical protein QBC39DRAFT_149124 [Podospora conica]|nr:hypothetical protein QBC39DRAFT_149124 [Schizothecium conicum]